MIILGKNGLKLNINNKKILFLLFLFPVLIFSQNREEGYMLFPKCKELVMEEQELYECNSHELQKFIARHLEYPEKAIQEGYEGKVYVKYILTAEGKFKISVVSKNKTDSSLTDAALQVMYKLNDSINGGDIKIIPAKVKGKTINSHYRLPIQFTLTKRTVDATKKIVIITYRTSEKTVQFRRDLAGNIYAYGLFPEGEKMLLKIDGDTDPLQLTSEEQSYLFLYNLTFLKSEVLLTLGEIDGINYELFIDKDVFPSGMKINVYTDDNPNEPVEIFQNTDELFLSKYAPLIFK